MLQSPTKISLSSHRWSKRSNSGGTRATYLRETAFLGDVRLDVDAVDATLPPEGSPPDLWESALQKLTGFYAIIRQEPCRILAAVDRVRSMPLFYGKTSELVFLSDDAEWVRQQVDDAVMDPVAREEFLLAGYVTGQETLYPNVRQLQAGEMLIVDQSAGSPEVSTHRYYHFLHMEPDEYDELVLREELDRVVTATIERLIEYAGGRRVVVPLSGGYDSRLIVTLLKRLGYQNLLAFSYGLRGNREAKYSRIVADTLGIPWHFVEYTNAMWAQQWRSATAERFRREASGHSSLPNIQDWLAVKIMVEEGIVDGDCVVVPGHTGDFISGGHIPDLVFTQEEHTQTELVQQIVKKHFSNAPPQDCQLLVSSLLPGRIMSRISRPFDGSSTSFADSFEQFEWQERQAKYIVNSVRVYDTFGLDWWLPLWDGEFMAFWERVPLELRRGGEWYVSFVNATYRQEVGQATLSVSLENAADRPAESRMRRLARSMVHLLPATLTRPLRRLRTIRRYEQHFLAFGGLVEPKLLRSYLRQGYNIIGVYSDLFLRSEWGAR